MTALLPLVEIVTGSFWIGLVVFLRVGAMMMAMPALGEQMIPARFKLFIALMMTTVVTPAVAPHLDLPEPTLNVFLYAIATETIAGLFMGMMLRMFVMAIQVAGAMAAQSTSLSQILGSAGMDPLPAIGQILFMATLALLMTTGFHVKAAMFIMLSYEILPALEFPNPADVAEAGAMRVSKTVSLAFTLAAPFVILSVLYNLTLGVINKAMPQLMVAFVGAPVITFGAMAMLLVAAPLMLTVWFEAFEAFLVAPFR